MHDQAQRLRDMVAQQNQTARNTRVITVTSGKGGVGKSNFTLNYALALAESGKKVVILDADVGFANIDVLMGVKPKKTLAELIRREATVWDILEPGPNGLEFIAGGSGFRDLLSLKAEQFDYVVEQLSALQGYADYVLIDTGAGLNEQTLSLLLASDEVFVVLTPEPTSITDAYALIKMVVNRDSNTKLRLVINRAQNASEGRETAEKIRLVAERFLGLQIETFCVLPDDLTVTRAVRQQSPFYLAHPNCEASKSLRAVVYAEETGGAVQRVGHAGGMKQFLSRMTRMFR